jgi:hypothetical protein
MIPVAIVISSLIIGIVGLAYLVDIGRDIRRHEALLDQMKQMLAAYNWQVETTIRSLGVQPPPVPPPDEVPEIEPDAPEPESLWPATRRPSRYSAQLERRSRMMRMRNN